MFAGVLQKSVVHFVVDIVNNLFVRILINADNVKLYFKIRRSADCETLRRNLYILINSCVIDKLSLKTQTKCYKIFFFQKHASHIYSYKLGSVLFNKLKVIRY